MNNQSALAGLLQTRMNRTYERGSSCPPLELGTITGDLSLQVDGLPVPIKEYMVCRQLTLGAKDDVLTKTQVKGKDNDGKHIHSDPSPNGATDIDSEHIHDVLIPEKMQKLKAGDRVLVAWPSGIPVIVDIVFDKSEMG